MKLLTLVAVVCLVLCIVDGGAHGVTPRTADECRQLGFLKSEVKCELCAPLLQHTENAALHAECLSCCSITTNGAGDGAASADPLYVKARIEYKSEEKLRDSTVSQTAIHTFVQKYLDDAPYKDRLEIREDRFARMPRLVLLTEEDEQIAVRIETWQAFQIDEFLRKRLASS